MCAGSLRAGSGVDHLLHALLPGSENAWAPPQVPYSIDHTVDGQIRLIHFIRFSNGELPCVSSLTDGQTTNFHLHDEKTVNGIRKMPALLFSF